MSSPTARVYARSVISEMPGPRRVREPESVISFYMTADEPLYVIWSDQMCLRG